MVRNRTECQALGAGVSPTAWFSQELLPQQPRAYCGKYTVDGSKLSTIPDTAWAPAWLSSPHDGKWEIKGKTLTVETTPFKSMHDGVEVIAIVQYERE